MNAHLIENPVFYAHFSGCAACLAFAAAQCAYRSAWSVLVMLQCIG